jgi:hypothetical protein
MNFSPGSMVLPETEQIPRERWTSYPPGLPVEDVACVEVVAGAAVLI